MEKHQPGERERRAGTDLNFNVPAEVVKINEEMRIPEEVTV